MRKLSIMSDWLGRAIKYSTSELLEFKSTIEQKRQLQPAHSGRTIMFEIIALN